MKNKLASLAKIQPYLRQNRKWLTWLAGLVLLVGCCNPYFVDEYLCAPGKDVEAELKAAVLASGGDFQLKYNSCDPYYVYCYLPTDKVDTLAIRRVHHHLWAQSAQKGKPSWTFMAVCGPGRDANVLFVHRYPDIITEYLAR
jgi:hypothetical protein